jgi:hypothetical protein
MKSGTTLETHLVDNEVNVFRGTTRSIRIGCGGTVGRNGVWRGYYFDIETSPKWLEV